MTDHVQATETVGIAKALVSFGEAIKALKQGKRITRKYFDYEEVFIFRQVPSSVASHIVPKMTSLPDSVKKEFTKREKESSATHTKEHLSIRYQNQLAIVFSNNVIEGWSPTADDALAEDWIILD